MSELKRILHVDDDPDIRELVKLGLELMAGFEIEQVASGQAAIEAAKRNIPDLILLDQMMPNMSGDETLRELRKLPGLQKTLVVFMTAKADADGDTPGVLKATDAVAVLRKPFDITTLANRLKEIWQTHC